jgi:hypothetical protein
VQIMGDIYFNANKVLLWLGEAVEETRKAFDLIRWLHEFFNQNDTSYSPGYFDLRPQDDTLLIRKLHGMTLFDIDWHPLAELLQRPWFQRL